MKKKIMFFLSLSLVAGLGMSWLWLFEKDLVEAQNGPTEAHPLAAINQKAKAARSGNLPDAEEYIGELIKVAGFENELQGFTSTAIKNRVGRAESRYRLGQEEGIPEAKIVRTVNGLVKKFNLPRYSRTNLYEVRRLRLGLLPNFPQIITQKKQGVQSVFVGAQIDSQMSPAEAVFVLAMMLQQKMVNPEFQLTHTERVNRWAGSHNHVGGQSNSPNPDQNRSREIKEALSLAVASTSTSDALQMSGITLNTLGIKQ